MVDMQLLCSYTYNKSSHLHSFPTRRSSDLPCGSLRAILPTLRSARARYAPTRRRLCTRAAAARTAKRTSDALCLKRTRRSEEHTSELQSQSKLVCRLLLEKKNRLLNLLSCA